jgi:hypothetical protein
LPILFFDLEEGVMYNVIAQTLGILGCGLNVISYQQKKKFMLAMCQLFGCIFFAVHFFMLGQYVASMMNVIAFLRAVVFAKNYAKPTRNAIVAAFMVLCVVCYVLNFTVFKMEWSTANALLQIIPVVAMFFAILAMSMENAKLVRRFSLVASPLWLINNIIVVSVGGIACEAISLVSIFVGMLRHDIKKKS